MARLTHSEFSSIVDDVAAGMYRIRSASAAGFNARIEFASRSGKQSVYASLLFDADTGRCSTIVCPHIGANQPQSFAAEVERRIEQHH